MCSDQAVLQSRTAHHRHNSTENVNSMASRARREALKSSYFCTQYIICN